MRKITTAILTSERSEEEKLRRHLHGDKGARFSGGQDSEDRPRSGDRDGDNDGDKGLVID